MFLVNNDGLMQIAIIYVDTANVDITVTFTQFPMLTLTVSWPLCQLGRCGPDQSFHKTVFPSSFLCLLFMIESTLPSSEHSNFCLLKLPDVFCGDLNYDLWDLGKCSFLPFQGHPGV